MQGNPTRNGYDQLTAQPSIFIRKPRRTRKIVYIRTTRIFILNPTGRFRMRQFMREHAKRIPEPDVSVFLSWNFGLAAPLHFRLGCFLGHFSLVLFSFLTFFFCFFCLLGLFCFIGWVWVWVRVRGLPKGCCYLLLLYVCDVWMYILGFWVCVLYFGPGFCIYTYCEIEKIYSARCTIASKSKRSSLVSGSFFLWNILFPNACIAVPFVGGSVLRKS